MATAISRKPIEGGTAVTGRRPNGAAAVALLAAGFGVFITGLMTTAAETSPVFGNALNWWKPGGSLIGKTGVGVIAWLIAWGILHARYKETNVNLGRAITWTWVLILLGFVLTFPPFFDLFAK